jgi:hypothetical protein
MVLQNFVDNFTSGLVEWHLLHIVPIQCAVNLATVYISPLWGIECWVTLLTGYEALYWAAMCLAHNSFYILLACFPFAIHLW